MCVKLILKALEPRFLKKKGNFSFKFCSFHLKNSISNSKFCSFLSKYSIFHSNSLKIFNFSFKFCSFHTKNREYPFCVSLITVIHSILEELNLVASIPQRKKNTGPASFVASDEKWSTPLFSFLCSQFEIQKQENLAQNQLPTSSVFPFVEFVSSIRPDFQRDSCSEISDSEFLVAQNVFFEVISVFCFTLDKIFEMQNASYMDYPAVLQSTIEKFRNAIAEKPETMQDLKRILEM